MHIERPCQTPMMGLLGGNSKGFLDVNYFLKAALL